MTCQEFEAQIGVDPDVETFDDVEEFHQHADQCPECEMRLIVLAKHFAEHASDEQVYAATKRGMRRAWAHELSREEEESR